jgi:16S rRNA (uracil1498-N3)-methyltransferase
VRRRGGAEPEQVLYSDAVAGPGPVVITGSEADHARRSLRMHSGDPVALVDGRGTRYHGRVTDLGKHSVSVTVDRQEPVPVWPSRVFRVGAGVLRSTRMDAVVEKASELGAATLVPLQLKHCVARPHDEGAKLDRWRRIAVESLKQCKRAMLMEVAAPETLEDFLAGIPAGTSLWAADPGGVPPQDAAAQVPATADLTLVVGPEGGLADEELRLLRDRGAQLVALGGHRLRAETAVMTLLTAALTTLAELGPSSADPLRESETASP